MMTRTVCWLLLAHTLTGCASIARHTVEPAAPQPLLLVAGEPWNAALRNPHPPKYGNGQAAGCVVEGEFQVAIDHITGDPAGGRVRIDGRLLAPQGMEGPMVALLTWNEAGDDGRKAATSANPFSLDVDVGRDSTLAISLPGYRTLQVDLRMLSRRAVPAPGMRGP